MIVLVFAALLLVACVACFSAKASALPTERSMEPDELLDRQARHWGGYGNRGGYGYNHHHHHPPPQHHHNGGQRHWG